MRFAPPRLLVGECEVGLAARYHDLGFRLSVLPARITHRSINLTLGGLVDGTSDQASLGWTPVLGATAHQPVYQSHHNDHYQNQLFSC